MIMINSAEFIIFFMISSIIYYFLPEKLKYVYLLIISFVFYLSFGLNMFLIIAFITAISYVLGIFQGIFNNVKMLCINICLVICCLFYFKYLNWGIENIQSILLKSGRNFSVETYSIITPIGISYVLFQVISYYVDIYRNQVAVQKNFMKYSLYIMFFPKIIAGPIERSENFFAEINHSHKFNYDLVKNGLIYMGWGYFLKMVIADRIAIVVDNVYANLNLYTGLILVVVSVLYTIQIYTDFAGYSYIALGAAQVLGYKITLNFQAPYFSRNISEFWRRWHVSLSSWLKDYVYIPLGGNRKGKLRQYINLMITFLLSGIWHGAGWNYVIWGGLHGLYQITGKIIKPVSTKLENIFNVRTQCFSYTLYQIILTFSCVNFAWIFFRAGNINVAFTYIKNMCTEWNPWVFWDGSMETLGLDYKDWIVLGIALLIVIFIESVKERMSINITAILAKQNLLFRWFVYFFFIYEIIIFGIYGSGYDSGAFIYFKF